MQEEIIFILLILLLAAFIFMPKYGYIALTNRMRKNSNKRKIEHVLKHLFDIEYRNLSGTIYSIAGALNVSTDKAGSVIMMLQKMKLIILNGDRIHLTDEGREYAGHVVRAHRLLETYLAEETGLDERLWHNEADKMEHDLTPEETEKLSAKLGHPLFDPHGDPIPGYKGDIAESFQGNIEDYPEGELVTVTHIEDEPGSVYKELLKKGVKAGVVFRILERNTDFTWIHLGGNQIKLSSIECANLSVKPYEKVKEPDNNITLDILKPGERAIIKKISDSCKGQQRKRLMDLGVIPGSEIRAEFRSASGDPVAYTIKGATIALRRNIAKGIYIEL